MMIALLIMLVAFGTTFITTPFLIRKFLANKLTGRDVHKKDKPDIPEMGGLTIVAGFVAGVLVAVAIFKLSSSGFVDFKFYELDITQIFAALTTILTIVIIGVFDDLVRMNQKVKVILPVFAALPLMAVAQVPRS